MHPCGIAAADFAPKNSPPDCFLYGAHPLRVRRDSNPTSSQTNVEFCAKMVLVVVTARKTCETQSVSGGSNISTNEKRECHQLVTLSFFGPPGGIRTPGLWNRNPLRYPASPRADVGLLYEQTPLYTTSARFARGNLSNGGIVENSAAPCDPQSHGGDVVRGAVFGIPGGGAYRSGQIRHTAVGRIIP